MEVSAILEANEWAGMTYGGVRLGDERRTQRAVQIASAMARDPMASFPKQMGGQAASDQRRTASWKAPRPAMNG